MKFNVLDNFISPVTGRILCDFNYVLVGNTQGVAIPMPGIPFGNLPDLTYNKTWVGDASDRPIEKVYVGDSTFLIRLTNADLPNAQALQSLGTGLLKVIADGYVALAILGTDYVNATALEFIKNEIVPLATAAGANAFLILESSRAAVISAASAAEEAYYANIDYETAKNNVERLLRDGLSAFDNYGDVNIRNFRVTNLKQSPEGDFDVLGFTFLWDLMHDRVDILWP
jgi:hypothetical protein